tara:strand:+ start:388 stop:699 length:312 start_codon:yes stop_codon:yes gene_type:complete
MKQAPEAIFLYIPLMKELGLSWTEIKSCTNQELEGLLYGLSQYNQFHQFDGYDENDIAQLAKSKPQVRSDYYKYREVKDSYEEKLGIRKPTKTPSELASELKL